MATTDRVWRAADPLDGRKVTIRRKSFATQAEQVKYLRQMVAAYRGTQGIRSLARDVVFRVLQLPPKRRAAHAVGIASWVQGRITYVNEGDETFQTPIETLRSGYGDCDDFSTLIAALCESLGVPTELVALEWGGTRLPFGFWVGGQFRHIFPRAIVPGPDGRPLRLPLDATLDQPVEALTDPVLIAVRRGVRPRTLVL